MKPQLFKTIALLLCLSILFVSVIPQANAGWGFWKCLGLAVSILAAQAAALAACSASATNPAAVPACINLTAIWIGLLVLFEKKCG